MANSASISATDARCTAFSFVEAFQEQQVSDLLDYFERIGDAARPERIPDGVNLAANGASEYSSSVGGE